MLARQIFQDEAERNKLKGSIEELTQRLSNVSVQYDNNIKKKLDLDKTIEQTEAAYNKIMESSHALLHVGSLVSPYWQCQC